MAIWLFPVKNNRRIYVGKFKWWDTSMNFVNIPERMQFVKMKMARHFSSQPFVEHFKLRALFFSLNCLESKNFLRTGEKKRQGETGREVKQNELNDAGRLIIQQSENRSSSSQSIFMQKRTAYSFIRNWRIESGADYRAGIGSSPTELQSIATFLAFGTICWHFSRILNWV